ncbi:MAG: arginine deiminase [Caldilineae bacterium]|nr:arginine deiminase [Chloroflexota bacterium]MCB9175559.1 arginine deiminase [Caldilineae bacterium]
MSQIRIDSEIGRLRTVLVHEPGLEIENMTPASAAESLYDDLLFLEPAQAEHRRLTQVLARVAEVLQLLDLLADVLSDRNLRWRLVSRLCELHACPELVPELVELPARELAEQLLSGTPLRKDTLKRFLSASRYALPPLPNAFFMRDATMCVNDRVIVGSMATGVRQSEAIILRAIFRHHPALAGNGFYLDGTQKDAPSVTIEGGDVLVLREDLLVIGYSERTSADGIDVLLEALAKAGTVRDVVVVELPQARATIHLDMIFTMIDREHCVVYSPLVTEARRCRAIHVRLGGGQVASIAARVGLLEALEALGLPLEPIACGGDDPLRQDREQWASGANFFALAPGKVIGYERNRATFDALAKRGFRVVSAADAASGAVDLEGPERVAIAMPGEELNRGGGGCRCMTLPIARDAVNWAGARAVERS